MVLIWAMAEPHYKDKGKRRPPEMEARLKEMRRRARLLLDKLKDDGTDIVVPTIAASECLNGIAENRHGTFSAKLSDFFIPATFDPPSAALAAKLFQAVCDLPVEERPERVCMKADVMVVASAKAAGATVFYSDDVKVRKMAQILGMLGLPLPVNPHHLFADEKSSKD